MSCCKKDCDSTSGNNFTAGSTDELKSLKWTSYKE